MASYLQGAGMAVKSLFKNQKSLPKWVENATPGDIQQALTETYVKGNEEENFAPVLTSAELITLKKNPKSVSQADTGLSECLSFYAGYPFQPLPLPLECDDLLRAVVALTGRDEKALGTRDVKGSGETEKVFRRGKDADDKLRLLFCALSGAQPNQDDVLDVLTLVQPRPDETKLPLSHSNLLPMAMRLAPPKTTAATTIPKEKLTALMKAVDFEGPAVEEDIVSLEIFKKLVNEKPGFLDAISRKVTALFLN